MKTSMQAEAKKKEQRRRAARNQMATRRPRARASKRATDSHSCRRLGPQRAPRLICFLLRFCIMKVAIGIANIIY